MLFFDGMKRMVVEVGLKESGFQLFYSSYGLHPEIHIARTKKNPFNRWGALESTIPSKKIM